MWQVASSENTPLLTCLLEGPPGSGKTALAAKLGLDSNFPFVKVISSNSMVGYSEAAKAQQIAKVFDDAYRVSVHLLYLSSAWFFLRKAAYKCSTFKQRLQNSMTGLAEPPCANIEGAARLTS
jgi:chromosomal replication initiation ATPase DnaA